MPGAAYLSPQTPEKICGLQPQIPGRAARDLSSRNVLPLRSPCWDRKRATAGLPPAASCARSQSVNTTATSPLDGRVLTREAVPGNAPVQIAFIRTGARELYAQGRQEDFLAPATALSAGFDLRACLDDDEARISPGARLAIPTGVSVQPQAPGIAGFVYSRSGLGARDGLAVAQGVGVIDPDYTGEILVVLLNTSGQERRLARGERMGATDFPALCPPTVAGSAGTDGNSAGRGGIRPYRTLKPGFRVSDVCRGAGVEPSRACRTGYNKNTFFRRENFERNRA